MTFSRAKAAGFKDNTQSVTAAELETLDDNQSKAVDGARGGDYSPSSTLVINGEGLGSNNLRDITVTGVLVRETHARWEWKTSVTEITDVATTQVIDMEKDSYAYTASDHTNNITIHLSKTTGFTPTAGDILRVTRLNIPSTTKTFKIYSEETPGTAIAEFHDGGTAPVQSNEVQFGEFWFNGTTWKPLYLSCDVIG